MDNAANPVGGFGIGRIAMSSVASLQNRQRAAGTRRVHQLGHARARAGTADTP
jgi:hypothetical protein